MKQKKNLKKQRNERGKLTMLSPISNLSSDFGRSIQSFTSLGLMQLGRIWDSCGNLVKRQAQWMFLRGVEMEPPQPEPPSVDWPTPDPLPEPDPEDDDE